MSEELKSNWKKVYTKNCNSIKEPGDEGVRQNECRDLEMNE